MVGAAYQYIRLQTDGAQLLDRMLGWLGLGFTSRGDIRDQRQVHQHRAFRAHFDAKLADCLKKGLRLDVADRAANLHQRDVSIASAFDDAALDFVSDVRNHLNGGAQVVTTALATQYIFVDAAGGEVVALGHRGADEPLVMAQI